MTATKLYHLVTEAYGCEQLAQGRRYLAVERPGVQLATSRVSSQRLNHYNTRPHNKRSTGIHALNYRRVYLVNSYLVLLQYYHNRFTALQILSGTTRVSRYQKGKTKTNPDFLQYYRKLLHSVMGLYIRCSFASNNCHSLSLAPVNPDWFYRSGTGSPGWSRVVVTLQVTEPRLQASSPRRHLDLFVNIFFQ